MRFKGKAALVTGGASGIGAATAQLLADEGARVAIVDLNEAGARAQAEAIGDAAIFHACDVGRIEDVEATVAAVAQGLGAIDLLVNAAGIGAPPGRATDIDPAAWRQTMAVNLDSIFYFARYAVPHMRGRNGAIVNIASVSGMAGDMGFSAYNASKAAVVNYTRTLALDHMPDGIRVNSVAPGYIDTPLTAGSNVGDLRERWIARAPIGRAGRPEEIAQVIAFLLSDQASFVTGANIIADGGMLAWTAQPNILEAFGL